MENNEQKDEAEVLQAITRDRDVRRLIASQSHLMFFHLYFPHYVQYPIAEFQKDIFRITEDAANSLACIVAFRGSGKSTLVTFSYTLWAILGVQQKKFVLIICQTQAQARQHMANLKYELEQNVLLKSDLGPFREDIGSGEWAMSSLVFKNSGARVMIASLDQSIRGIRHHEHRPDLIILDDIEDINSTKTSESREIIPLGDIGTRIVLIGNLLHEDSLMMRLKKKIDTQEMRGIFRWYPLIDGAGQCLWPGKFDTPEKIDELKQRIGDEAAWYREYLLRIISGVERVIHPEWITSYDTLPSKKSEEFHATYYAADLAISQSASADYTAIVGAQIFGHGDSLRIYILPNPINSRLTFPDVIACMKTIVPQLQNVDQLFVEAQGFQEGYVQTMIHDGYNHVKGVKVTTDKRTRLAITGELLRSGKVLFPDTGCEELISQIVNFGSERHDDLADAFSMLIAQVMALEADNSSFYNWMEFCKENGGPYLRW